MTDRDTVIAVAGGGKKELLEKHISSSLECALEKRKLYCSSETEKGIISATEDTEAYYVYLAAPILSQGDLMGGMLFITDTEEKIPNDTEIALAETAASFLGRHMED